MSYRVLICGSRDWDDKRGMEVVILGFMERYGDRLQIIHGAASGADEMVAGIAESLGIAVKAFPADWRGLGRRAGPVRNKLMLTEGKPHVVFAFKNDFDWTFSKGGTENMVHIALDAGVPAYVISSC